MCMFCRVFIAGEIDPEVDAMLSDLKPHEYCIMPSSKDETIAWVLWHIARIEDLTMGILAADGEQLFDDQWKNRLSCPLRRIAGFCRFSVKPRVFKAYQRLPSFSYISL